ncbi:hypothetical protein H5T51_08285 [Candidatus Bathyarchaeota archaeon]|nr:hypothetical protein [Candidatus Bathyarchaeota archaeon]
MSEGFKASDVLYAVIVPCIVAFLIIAFPHYLAPALDPTLRAIIVFGLGEAILIVAVPMLFGLLWNQWAGGASGFLLGSVYALYVNDSFAAAQAWTPDGMIGDISNLGYVVCAMLTGYIAGALNKGSFSFKRMVGAALTGGIIGGLFLLYTQLISPFGMVTDVYYNLFVTLLPRIVYGIVIPIIAKVFSWYGLILRRM